MRRKTYYDVEVHPDGTWRVDYVTERGGDASLHPVGRGMCSSTEEAAKAARAKIERHKESRRLAAERDRDVIRFRVEDD